MLWGAMCARSADRVTHQQRRQRKLVEVKYCMARSEYGGRGRGPISMEALRSQRRQRGKVPGRRPPIAKSS